MTLLAFIPKKTELFKIKCEKYSQENDEYNHGDENDDADHVTTPCQRVVQRAVCNSAHELAIQINLLQFIMIVD